MMLLLEKNKTIGLDFQDYFSHPARYSGSYKDDQHEAGIKKELCKEMGASYYKLPKTPPKFEPVSTAYIVKWIKST